MKSDSPIRSLTINDDKNLIIYLFYSIVLCLLVFVQINIFVVGTLIICAVFLSIKSIYKSTYFFVALWPMYFYIILWVNHDNWNNIKFILGNTTIFYLIILKYADYEDIKKSIPFFLIVLFYLLYSQVPVFTRLFSVRNSISLVFMALFFRQLIKNRIKYEFFSESCLHIILVFALLSIFSFLYYPILEKYWKEAFDYLHYQKRGMDTEFDRSFWESGNTITRIGSYYIPRFSGLYFNAITTGYIFGCSYAISFFRKKYGYAVIFALASLLTFAKVSWMIIAYASVIFVLRKRMTDKRIFIFSLIFINLFFVVIYFDIIPSGAVIHLVGFIEIMKDLHHHIMGQGLGTGGTWGLTVKHLNQALRAGVGAGSESGLGTLIAEIGLTGCIFYFMALYKLFNVKLYGGFSWAFVLLVIGLMILQENYASPIPAFVLTWMLFEVTGRYDAAQDRVGETRPDYHSVEECV